MAKRPNSDNFDALGSVFDFLFDEAKKPPERRKPIVPTGISSDSELTEGIVAALEKPGAFISDTVVSEFNDALDVEMVRFKYGEFGSVKLTSNTLVDFLKDPQAAFDKAVKVQKAIRKTQRVTFLGAMMDDFITSGWAHKYGNLEAQRAVFGANVANRYESYKIERAFGQFSGSHAEDPPSKTQGTSVPGKFSPRDLNFMAERSFDLLGNETFGANWGNLSVEEKGAFASMVSGGVKMSDIDDIKDELRRRYANTIPDIDVRFSNAIGNSFKPQQPIDIFSGKFYKNLETNNLNNRIADPNTPEDEKKIYEKTLYLLQRNKVELRNSIDNIKQSLRNAPPDQRQRLRQELKDAKGALRAIEGHTLFGRIGQIEGYVNSLNTVYGGVLGTNAVASILNGDLYDKRKNSIFLPVEDKKIGGVEEIFVKKGSKNKWIDKYNGVLTEAYYFTPRAAFRTFFYNGEGFAYMLNKRLEKIKSLPEFQALANLGIDGNFLDTGFNGKDIDTFVNNLIGNARQNLTPEQLANLEKLLKSSKNLRKVTTFFSSPYRVKKALTDLFADKVKAARVKVKDWILKNPRVLAWFAKSGANKLLEAWAMKGGLDVFMRSIIGAAASALGITLGPLGTVVANAVAWVATDFAMKAVGQIMVIGKYFLLGLVGLVVLLFTWSASTNKAFFEDNFSYYHVPPGSVVMCSMYEEIELKSPEDYPWGDAIIPPPSGEKCVFGTGTYGCSQGYKDVKGWSHQNYTNNMPVDLTYIGYVYAPQFCNAGDCRITRIAVINCRDGSNAGGIVELTANDGRNTYFFKLLHVKPLASLGEKLSSGQAVAVVQDAPEVEKGNCWTGKHLHLETKQNGSVVDPLELLQSFSCLVPDEKDCSRP